MDEPDRSSKPHNDNAHHDPHGLGEADDQPPPAGSVPDGAGSSIQVEIFDSQRLLSEQAYATLSGLATRALACLTRHGQVRVRIVDDRAMSIAHEQFSGITGTTDVLTFDLADPKSSWEEKILDTDLTVCFDEAVRQAIELKHPVEHELLLYIIHGTLHCLGYDDHDEAGYQRMHTKEDEVLNQIGIAPTFFVQPDPSTKENRS